MTTKELRCEEKQVVLRTPKNPNAFVEEYLDEYIGMSDVDFAVLISGLWGCGKTTLVSRWMAETKVLKKKKCVYVSVNGAATIEEIKHRVFEQAYPTTAKVLAVAKCVSSAVSPFVGTLSCTKGTKGVSAEAHFDQLEKLVPKRMNVHCDVLVFDDVERAVVGIEELLGYFSKLLTDGTKVILVGDERILSKRWCDQKDDAKGLCVQGYEKQKEKVIGQTFALVENFDDLFGVLVDDVHCDSIRNILINQRAVLVKDFRSVDGVCNYRAFKHACRDVDYWFRRLPGTARKNDEYAKLFVRMVLLIDYELLVNTLKAEDLGVIPKEGSSAFIEFLDRHNIRRPSWGNVNEYLSLPIELLKQMLVAHSARREDIENAVSLLSWFVPKKNPPSWRVLLQWWNLDRHDLDRVISNLQGDLENARISDARDFMHSIAVLGQLVAQRLLPDSPQSFVKSCKRYIEHAISNGAFKDVILSNVSINEQIASRNSGLFYAGEWQQDDYYKVLKSLFCDALQKKRAEMLRVKTEEMVKRLQDDPGSCIKELLQQELDPCLDPVLQNIKVSLFYKCIKDLSAKDLRKMTNIFCSWTVIPERQNMERPFWDRLLKCMNKDLLKVQKKKVREPLDFALWYMYKSLLESLGKKCDIVFEGRKFGDGKHRRHVS